MKTIAIILTLLPFAVFSQLLNLDFSEKSMLNPSNEVASVSEWLDAQQNKNFLLPSNQQVLKQQYKSPLMNFTQDQFMMNVYPDPDFSNLTEITFGSYMSQRFSIGNLDLTQDYLFDRSGNLRSSQLSFNLGRN